MFSLFPIPGWGYGRVAPNCNSDLMMANIFGLEGKTAAVLGGASSIGRALDLASPTPELLVLPRVITFARDCKGAY
jgi:hypothetical protein